MTNVTQQLTRILPYLHPLERVVLSADRDTRPLAFRKHASTTAAGRAGLYNVTLTPTAFAGHRPRVEKVSGLDAANVLRVVTTFLSNVRMQVEVLDVAPATPLRVAPIHPFILKEFPDEEPIQFREANADRHWSLAPNLDLENAITADKITGRPVFLRPDAADGVIRQVYNPDTVRAFPTRSSPYTRCELRGATDFTYVPLALLH